MPIQPTNKNFLQLSKFIFTIPNLPFGNFYLQDVNLPGVSTVSPIVDTPFSKTKRHGDKLEYEQLRITCLVDEDLRVWEETYNWLVSMTFPHRYEEYAKIPIYNDGILTSLKNSNLPNFKIKYTACHPIAISGLNYSTKEDAQHTPTVDIVFDYDTFSFERTD